MLHLKQTNLDLKNHEIRLSKSYQKRYNFTDEINKINKKNHQEKEFIISLIKCLEFGLEHAHEYFDKKIIEKLKQENIIKELENYYLINDLLLFILSLKHL